MVPFRECSTGDREFATELVIGDLGALSTVNLLAEIEARVAAQVALREKGGD